MGKKILVLAPHTDDGELGCGGTIAKLLEEGNDIYYVAFSICEDSVPEGYPKNILDIELHNAMNSFGISDDKIITLRYRVRRFSEQRQEILDDMICIARKIEPDIVFAPSIKDVHQDHHVIAEEAMRAFKKTTLLAYEVPWNNFSFNNQTYVVLEKRHIEAKIKAIACYTSQKDRQYVLPEFTYAQAMVHGTQIGQKWAEVFELVRQIIM